MESEIRLAFPGDAENIVELFKEVYWHYHDDTFLQTPRLENYLADPLKHCLIAMRHGACVGFAAVEIEKFQAKLCHFATHPLFGRGIGLLLEGARQRLLRRLATSNAAIQLAYAHCVCSSPASEVLKLRHGFHPVALKLAHMPDVRGLGHRESYVVVAKPLSQKGEMKPFFVTGNLPQNMRSVMDQFGLVINDVVASKNPKELFFESEERIDSRLSRADLLIRNYGGHGDALTLAQLFRRLSQILPTVDSTVCYADATQEDIASALSMLFMQLRFFRIGLFPSYGSVAIDSPATGPMPFTLWQHLRFSGLARKPKSASTGRSSIDIRKWVWHEYSSLA